MKTYNFSDLRKWGTAPNYPAYSNMLIEPFFYNFFTQNINDFLIKDRTYIPIFFTSIYIENQNINVQEYINALDPNGKYFTIIQHDDSIRETLPKDTLIFGCAKDYRNYKTIPIPLIGESIPNKLKEPYIDDEKEYLASFVGTITHPMRQKIWNYHSNNNEFYFDTPRSWANYISDNDTNRFIEISMKSKFMLCPRGYSATSFRQYEAMQLDTIPVIISDSFWLPWQDELKWDDFCVIIEPEQIPDLYNILSGISEKQKTQMKNKIKEIYTDYFSLEGVCKNILARL